MIHHTLPRIFTTLSLLASCALGAKPPQVLDTVPPADGSRGLVRVNKQEIRHYGGEVEVGEAIPYIVSYDNGTTWSELKSAQEKFPKKYSGLPNEAPAIVYLPQAKKYILIQAIGDFFFMADELDGDWLIPSQDGKTWLGQEIWANDRDQVYHLPKGLYRNPLELSTGRIIIATRHSKKGSQFLYSDDKGLTWQLSKGHIFVDAYKEPVFDLAPRWRNSGVEASAVELKDGSLYCLVRSDQNFCYESTSTDGGDTWSEPKPSPFYGTLTMPTLGRLKNGKLICLWTNTAPLPELAHEEGSTWEDVFTNRGALHVAFSKDEGKTWDGYREVFIDALRDSPTFATEPGKHDRSCHQAEFLELDDQRILISAGQHPLHRKMIIIEQDWVEERDRSEDFATDGLQNINSYVFVPPSYRIQYNRKSGIERVDSTGDGKLDAIKFGNLNDPSLQNDTPPTSDFHRSGVTWNFPKTWAGAVSFKLHFAEGSTGCHISLTDRMFNPCDTTTPLRGNFSIKLSPGSAIGATTLQANCDYNVTLKFVDNKCNLYIGNAEKEAISIPCINPSPIGGISYLHLISAANEQDPATSTPIEGSRFIQYKNGNKLEEQSCTLSNLRMVDLSRKERRKNISYNNCNKI